LTVFFAFLVVASLAGDWREDGWCRKDLVKVLELLACTLLVAISHCLVVDLHNVGEAVHDKCSKQHCVGHFVLLDRQAHETRKSLKLRDLNEAVNVVILEEERLEFHEALKFVDVGRADNVVESYVLERDLLHCLLEVWVVQNL
jgi:hypothetical protein